MAVIGLQSSRHIFYHTRNSSAPPANSKANDLKQLGGGEADAQHRRGNDYYEDLLGALFFR